MPINRNETSNGGNITRLQNYPFLFFGDYKSSISLQGSLFSNFNTNLFMVRGDSSLDLSSVTFENGTDQNLEINHRLGLIATLTNSNSFIGSVVVTNCVV